MCHMTQAPEDRILWTDFLGNLMEIEIEVEIEMEIESKTEMKMGTNADAVVVAEL